MTTLKTLYKNWFNKNPGLRMDANHPLWDEKRRNFHIERYKFALDFIAGKNVLDAACGTGYGADIMSASAAKVTGIDFDDQTVKYAQENYGKSTVDFQQSFAEFMPFDDSTFDVVTSFETVEHTLCPKSFILECTRVLKSDGTLILSAPNLWGLSDFHFYDYSLKMIEEDILPNFTSYELFYQNSGSFRGRFPVGIGKLNDIPAKRAECIILVAKGPKKNISKFDQRFKATMLEIYEASFDRHREYLNLYNKTTPVGLFRTFKALIRGYLSK